MMAETIRNFSIIAHIDHGKSTLADRMLEITSTVPERKMREQVLDQMELERERGITIKMQPVRMEYVFDGKKYILNLIDTPGHIDFSYEVSRALKAVEGVIRLVDAAQGVQAQTLSVLESARALALPIIPVVNKIDLPGARIADTKEDISRLLSCQRETILAVSGKTGEGAKGLLDEIVKRIPPPEVFEEKSLKSLVFDFDYSNHQGVIVYIRVFDGEVKKGNKLKFIGAGEEFIAQEVGVFVPEKKPSERIASGEIGYIVTGIKRPGIAQVGDTVTNPKNPSASVPGYTTPKPVVWASVYPESKDDFDALKQALGRLKLSDSSLSFEEEASGSLGRGFRCGFLGMLHLEIIAERLKREFKLALILATPTISYEIVKNDGTSEVIYSPSKFPNAGTYLQVLEPWVALTIITPTDFLGSIIQILPQHEAVTGATEVFGDGRIKLFVEMPLRELMRNFFDEIKSASSGYASLSYEIIGKKEANVTRMDILVAGERVPAFSKVIAERRAQKEAQDTVERLHTILPKQLFVFKIQAEVGGRIIASREMKALRKDVTGYLYGGDITRKMKIREKQKKGKKKMKERGSVEIPHDVFLKLIKE